MSRVALRDLTCTVCGLYRGDGHGYIEGQPLWHRALLQYPPDSVSLSPYLDALSAEQCVNAEHEQVDGN